MFQIYLNSNTRWERERENERRKNYFREELTFSIQMECLSTLIQVSKSPKGNLVSLVFNILGKTFYVGHRRHLFRLFSVFQKVCGYMF